MSRNGSVVADDRYTITEQGREDLRTLQTCYCELKLIGMYFACKFCETVYGYAGNWARAPRMHREKWN